MCDQTRNVESERLYYPYAGVPDTGPEKAKVETVGETEAARG